MIAFYESPSSIGNLCAVSKPGSQHDNRLLLRMPFVMMHKLNARI